MICVYVNIFDVNKSFIKFVTDFGPLAIFFFYYYNNDKDLKIAIPPFIIATLVTLALIWFLEKKIPLIKGIIGILFSKNQTSVNATKVAIIKGGIATVKSLSLL